MLPVTDDAVNYVDLTNDGFIVGKNPHADSVRFWDEFLHKYRDILSTTNSIPVS